MTEEIKQIKQTLETWQHIIDFGYGTIEVPNETKIFKTILNLIDKQQKEIEALKIIHETYKEEIKSIEDRYISKDKIRDKIKEYREKRIKLADGHFFDNPDNTTDDFVLFIGQEVLKDLLEEGEPDAK